MRKLSMVLSLIPTLLMVMIANSAQETESDIVFRLERGACLGTCPVYSVEIYADGTVIYDGQEHVEIEGEQTRQIESETVELMLDRFDALGYFAWDEQYNDAAVFDLLSVVTEVTKDNITHRIEHYTGSINAPIALTYLENWIDDAANTSEWTGANYTDPFISPVGPPAITLERTECQGICPVYRAAIFSDGTLIYFGKKYVNPLGIHVYQIDADEVARIVEWISPYYFEWEDVYDENSTPDMPFSITTLSDGGIGYKTIRRSFVDLNVPIGLDQFEAQLETIIRSLGED